MTLIHPGDAYSSSQMPYKSLRQIGRCSRSSGVTAKLWLSDETRYALESVLPKGAIVPMERTAATVRAVSESRLDSFGVLHFQVHGLADMAHPERSGLLLSELDDKGRRQAPLFNPRSVSELRLTGQIVFLAACRTAMGPYVKGEGMEGIAHGFLSAGASVVLGTSLGC